MKLAFHFCIHLGSERSAEVQAKQAGDNSGFIFFITVAYL